MAGERERGKKAGASDDWDGPTAGIEAAKALRASKRPPPARPAAPTDDDWDGPTAGIEAAAALRAAPPPAAGARAPAPSRRGEGPSANPDLALGSRLGEYAITRKLGEGEMGKVFAAVQPATGGKVALRVIPPELTRSAEVSQRFVGEVRAINRIGHRNLVDLYSVGRLHDGRLCLLMELIESEPLTALLQRATVLRLDEGVAIVLQLCEALAAAHTQGFVHGRLRPANVALGAGRTPVVKLMDFGLAALRGPASPPADAPAASVLYLAPEQCRGAAVDRRADVYALGVMLYEMFTGTTPFTGDSAADVMADHTSREPPPPSIHAHLPQPLEQLIVRTLRKKPEQRHGTVGELAKALKGLHADLPPVPPTLRLNRPG